MDAYKVISQLRLKKKPVGKKEKDAAFKALENRKIALQRLEDFGKNYNAYVIASAGSRGVPSSASASASSAGPSSSDSSAGLRVQV